MSRERPGWLAGGSMLAAIFASACCWLPLAAALAGASAGGLGVVLGKARPWLLSGSAVFLGVSFWLSYRRPACEPGSECASAAPRGRRWDRVALWFGVVVLAVSAISPNFCGLLSAWPSAAEDSAGIALGDGKNRADQVVGGEADLTVLSKDSRELRAAFNDAADKTRLVMLLSPT